MNTVKQIICLLALGILTSINSNMSISAQQFSEKYGSVTDYELNMTHCDLDSSASAVILYESGSVYYIYNTSQGFQKVMELKKRIKVLTEDGLSYGDIDLPYRYSTTLKEVITKLEGTVYNVEEGKTKTSKLTKSYIFDEKINEDARRKKATLPNVRVGSVIEYSYTITSDLYWQIPTWFFQSDIPIIKSVYQVEVPEYFKFNKLTYGYESFVSEQIDVSRSIIIPQGTREPASTINYTATRHTFTGVNMPPVKEENFVWNIRQYFSAIEFDITGVQFPNSIATIFSRTWRDVDKNIIESGLNAATKFSNPFKSESKLIQEKNISDRQKVREALQLVKRSVRWDKNYSLYPKRQKEIVDSRIGSNADINAVLYAVLKDLGYKIDLIVLQLRSNGMIRKERPSLNAYDTFILRVTLANGEEYFLDGSSDYGDINILPSVLLVNNARVLNMESDEWITLNSLAKNSLNQSIQGFVDSEGVFHGESRAVSSNQMSYSAKSKLHRYDNNDKYLEALENDMNIKIDSSFFSSTDTLSPVFNETIFFTKEMDLSADYIYVNPFIETFHNITSLSASERHYPIDFNYPYSIMYYFHILIPEGYMVEEIPSNIMNKYEEYNSTNRFIIGVNETSVSIRFDFTLGESMILPSDYEDFRNFWIETCNIYNNVIVFKKIKE